MQEIRIKLATNEPLLEGQLDSPKNAVLQMQKLIGEDAVESFVVVYLNHNLNAIGYHVVAKGNNNFAHVCPAEVFKGAFLTNATKIMLFHNHPSGRSNPSADDIRFTKALSALGKLFEIEVVDHIIFTNGCIRSFWEEGLIEPCSTTELLEEINAAVAEFNEKYSMRI